MAKGALPGHRSPRGTHQLEKIMRTIREVGALALMAIFTVGSASAGDDHDGGGGGNRILGLWETQAMVGSCDPLSTAPKMPIRNTLLFHAGGTVVENPRNAPSGTPNVAGIPGIYQRNQALGTWTYDRWTRRYFIHLRFDNFVDGTWHGYSIVDREIVLSNRGMLASGPVRSTRFYANGTLLNELCGEATGTPL
jgi:hypothetical protein